MWLNKNILPRIIVPYIILLIIGFLTKILILGNPFIYSDEEFYLFAGGRLLHGEMPFVDVWDRKPIGIFLLYAFFHLFGKWKVFAYQVGAVFSVWGTSLCIMESARKIAPLWGAFFAAVLYTVWVIGLHGEGGQSSIFYNVLVAASACLLVKRLPELWGSGTERGLGIVLMMLVGISIQIKYTTVFEGIYFGVFLLVSSYVSSNTIKKTILDGIIWVLCALFPSLCVVVFYICIGHFHDWYYSNIESIFYHKDVEDVHNFYWLIQISFVIFSCFIFNFIIKCFSKKIEIEDIFVYGWSISAFIGFIILGEYGKHYTLPLLVPFFTLSAVLWKKKWGKIWLVCLLLWGSVRGYSAEQKIIKNGGTRLLEEVTHVLSQPQGCVFVYTGHSAILDNTPYCHLTNYPFPAHLSFLSEKDALGVSPNNELNHIFSLRPLYMVSSEDRDDTSLENPVTHEIFYNEIKRKYHEVYRHHINSHYDDIIIFKRDN